MRHPPRLFDAYVFDLDGTVYLGDGLLPGALETVLALRRLDRPVVFLSNNPLGTRADYAAKLTRLGIETAPDDVINSSYVLVRHLRRTAARARLLVIGEESLERELRGGGLQVIDDPRAAEIVVASFDRTFDYGKLQQAFDAIRAGARFIATNRDPYCPVPGGGLPDCGAIIAAIEACTGHQVEEVVGKPSPIMAGVILERLRVPAGKVLLVGDRLETDVALARSAGMVSAIVLTGVTGADDIRHSPTRPTYVLSSLREVLPAADEEDGAGDQAADTRESGLLGWQVDQWKAFEEVLFAYRDMFFEAKKQEQYYVDVLAELSGKDIRSKMGSADAIREFLSRWHCRFSKTVFPSALSTWIGKNARELEGLQATSIRDKTLQGVLPGIDRLHASLANMKSAGFRNMTDACASRLLHLMAPSVCVMWDAQIKAKSERYGEFILQMHRLAVAIHASAPAAAQKDIEGYLQRRLGYPVRKPLTKYIDEYNWFRRVGQYQAG